MARFTYNGVVVETSDEVADRLPSGYEPAKEPTSSKSTTKKSSSSSSTKK